MRISKQPACSRAVRPNYGFYEDGQRSVRWSNAIWSLFSGVKSMSGVFAAPISGDEGLVGALVYVSQVQEIYRESP